MKSKKKAKYKKGKYPYTVLEVATGKLYVRKSVTVNKIVLDKKTGAEKFVKQRQIWRLCDPATATRSEEILASIEALISNRQTGRVAPLANFALIADEFAKVELTEAVYEKGKRIAGRRSVKSPRLTLEILKEHFGHYQIASITFGDIETYKSIRLKTPVVTKYKSRARSIRSVHYELGFLRQIFNFAYRRRWLERNPFDDGKNIINPSDETRRHVNWSREEEAAALALCEGKLLAHLKVVIICIVDGGFRRSELLNARWSEVDFENGFIPAHSYKGKNLHTRRIFLTDRMRETLLEWKKVQKTIKKITDKTLIIGYQDIKNAWNGIRRKIGREDLHIHDLRHVFATRLHIEAKAQISVISKMLGHSSTRTTEIYINAAEADVQNEITKLNELNEAFTAQKRKNKCSPV